MVEAEPGRRPSRLALVDVEEARHDAVGVSLQPRRRRVQVRCDERVRAYRDAKEQDAVGDRHACRSGPLQTAKPDAAFCARNLQPDRSEVRLKCGKDVRNDMGIGA